jgi:SAM-dependent methyltransferase
MIIKPVRRPAGDAETVRASRRWWDQTAPEYQAEHGEFLGDADFVWGPERLREADAHLLGDVTGRRVLEIGCGSAPCSRWLRSAGAEPVALDVSGGMLARAAELNRETGLSVGLLQADAGALPLTDDSVDLACSAFGGLPFVADARAVLTEVARVLRPGGRFAFSITHPTRWSFPDDPSEAGLTASTSYWDRTPYVEVDDESGQVAYVEHHRTLGDWVALLAGAGFRIVALLEPEWPADHDRVWGGWSRVRGRITPGTALFAADLGR